MFTAAALQGFDLPESLSLDRERSLLFIDPRVSKPEILLAGVRAGVEGIVLKTYLSGLEQIDMALRSRVGVREIHIVSHGEPGGFQLGNDWVDARLLERNAGLLGRWQEFLTENAAISIYACRAAAGLEGLELLQQLHELTGAGIAASVRPTGCAKQGGNWELETRVGTVWHQSAFTQGLQAEYSGIFATFTVDTLDDEDDGIDVGGVSLRDALAAAAEGDTIEFANSLLSVDNGLGVGVIGLNGTELAIDTGVTVLGDIDGNGIGDITIDAQGNSRVFNINDGGVDSSIEVTLTGLTIVGGSIVGQGGGILNGETLTLENATIDSNTATGDEGDGGGIANLSGTLNLIDSSVSGNTAEDDGGGIYNFDGATLTASNSTISNNSASNTLGNYGGGISNYLGSTASVTNSTLVGNAAFSGGGVSNFDSSTLSLSNSTVSSNTAGDGGGGGIFNADGEANVNNSTIDSNSSQTLGGGISNTVGGTLNVSSSTFSGNTASDFGGGISSFDDTTLNLSSSTISGNSAGAGGGVFDYYNSTLSLSGNLIAGNTSGFGGEIFGSGLAVSSTNNLFGESSQTDADAFIGFDPATGTDNITATSDGTSPTALDAILETTLADNGGPTLTLALVPGSPAIDTGSDTGTIADQRGAERPVGGFDIGAFEDFDNTAIVVDTLEDGADGDFSEGDRSLREALDFIAPGGTITFANSLLSADAGLGVGVIGLNGTELAIDAAVTVLGDIDGDGTGDITVDAQAGSRAFNITDGSTDSDIEVTLADLTIVGGSVVGKGGGILNSETLTLENATIGGNTVTGSDGDGAGVANLSGTLNLIDSTISGNSAEDDAGGIYNFDGATLSVSNSTISNNSAGSASGNYGGGISSYSNSEVSLSNSTVSGNSAYGGGGISNFSSSTLSVSNSTIGNNTAGDGAASFGGGILNTSSGEANIENSTISSNTASAAGGGVFSFDGSTLNLSSSTISGNSAGAGGGVFDFYNSTLSLSSNLIAGNTATNAGNEVYGSGLEVASTNNLFGDSSQANSDAFTGFDPATGTDNITATSDGTNPTALDAILETTLADNGGPTQTLALVSGSPAIDAGVNPLGLSFDQRGDGFARTVGVATDIGAFETQAPSIVSSDSVDVPENTTFVIDVDAVGIDGEGDGLIFSLEDEGDAALFTIDDQTGEINFLEAPDFESLADNTFSVTVTVTDSNNLSTSQTLTIAVTDAVDTVPELTIDATDVSVPENGTAVTTITVVPDGASTNPPVLTLEGPDADLFQIDPDTGEISFIDAPDFENPGDADGDNIFEVTVVAADGDDPNLTASENLTITVTDALDAAPELTIDATDVSVPENGTAVTTITVVPDGASTNPPVLTLEGPDADLFQIDPDTGEISFIDAPDFENPGDADGDNIFEVTVVAADGDNPNLTASEDLTITITDAIDAAPELTIDATDISVPENGTAVTTITVVPDGASTNPPVLTLEGPDADLFQIDPDTGEISFINPPDFENPGDADGDNIFEVTVVAADGDDPNFTASEDLTITVTDALDAAPELTIDATDVSVPENGTAVTTITVVPDGASTNPPVLTLEGPDADLFQIDPDTGEISFINPPDFENPGDADGDNIFEVTVVAADGDDPNLTASEDLTITITDAIDAAPELTIDATDISVPENGTAVTTITVVPDGASTNPPVLTLEGPDADLFQIDPDTGEISFIDAPDFENPGDADGDNVFEVTIVATDGDDPNLTASEDLTITITDAIDAAPELTIDATDISVPENGTAVTTITVVPDGASTNPPVLTLEGPDADLFQIDPDTGEISFINPPDFENPGDADGDNIFEVTVVATDGDDPNLTASEDLTITITDVVDEGDNTAPTLTVESVSVAENQTVVTTATAVDPDEGAADPILTLEGPDADLFQIDPDTGEISFIDAPDFENPGDADGDNIFEVTVVATDGDDPDITSSEAITVTVTDVLDAAPELTIDATDVSIAENGTTVTTITVVPDGASTNPPVLTLEGPDADLFQIDPDTGEISFINPPDFENPGDADGDNIFEVTVVATDGDDPNLTASEDLTITITDAIDAAPELTIDATDISVPENGTAVTTITVVPDGASTNPPVLTLEGPDADLFQIDPDTGEISFINPPDFENPGDADGDNIFEVTVVATDGDDPNLTASEDLTITITDVVDEGDNTAPTLTVESVSVAENQTVVTTATAVDPDEGAADPILTLEGPDADLFQIDPDTGEISFIDAPDFENPGDADGDNIFEVTVVAADGDDPDITSSEAITVTVTDVDDDINEPPVLLVDSISVDENQTFVTAATAVDPDSTNIPSFSLEGPDAGLFQIDPDTGEISFIDAPDFENPGDADGNNTFEITIVAADGDDPNLTTSDDIIVTLVGVNEAPELAEIDDDLSVDENQTTVITATAVDPDADASNPIFSLEGPDADLFQIDPDTGEIEFVVAPSFENPEDEDGDNIFNFTVIATDGDDDTLIDTQDVAFAVQDIPEPLVLDEVNLANGILSFDGDFTDAANASAALEVTINDFLNQEVDGNVPEVGVFLVDDESGAVNGVQPGDPDYLGAVLDQIAAGNGEVIFSVIPFQPDGFELGDLERFITPPGSDLGFFIIPESTFDTLSPDDTVFFSTTDEISFETEDGISSLSFTSDTPNIFGALTIDIELIDTTDIVGADNGIDDIDLLAANLQGSLESEVLDLTDASITAPVGVTATVTREAAFDNLVGFYVVEDINGTTAGITPGSPDFDLEAYTQAALTDNLVSGLDLLSASDGSTATFEGTLEPGAILAPFIVVDGSLEDALNGNAEIFFPYIDANSDGVDHVRLLGDNVFGFEDLTGGGDNDFNDIVVSLDFNIA